jgi:tRNA1(Val) A37 N6-methylase TrmN6
METQLLFENVLNTKFKKDFFSYTFEKNTPIETRHENGQYFTHKELVRLILDKIKINKDSKVLDPTCGAGAFLIEASDKTNINNIYGVDIDKNALSLCKLNLNSKSKSHPQNLIEADFIKDNLFEKEFFDVIIGNPPFINLKADGSDYDTKYPLYSEVLFGIGNSSTLVLAKSYELLKEGGYLGFVLPKNLLRVDSFNKIREFIVKNTKIISIIDVDHHFKDVRCDQILLVLQKKKLNSEELKNHFVSVTPYRKSAGLINTQNYLISQSEFLNYSFFPLFYSKEIKKIADRLLKVNTTLSDYSDIYRGLSISSSHNSLSRSKKRGLIKCYRGDSIKRFGLKYYLYLDKLKLSENEKNKLLKLWVDKIVIQNLFSKEGGIFLNYSKSDEVSLDTVTNIIPLKNINLYTLLGLLGSKLVNFFLINIIYLNSNFTMHTDKAYIGKIPIILPDKQKENLIQKYTTNLLNIEDKYSKEFKNVYDKLNKIIYGLYGLSEGDINLIEESLKGAMSKKHG